MRKKKKTGWKEKKRRHGDRGQMQNTGGKKKKESYTQTIATKTLMTKQQKTEKRMSGFHSQLKKTQTYTLYTQI